MTMTTTEEQQALDEFNEAWQQIRLHREGSTWDQELILAGQFVSRFGTLGDWFEEPNLSVVQFSQAGASAVAALGHWSVARNDPGEEPDDSFEAHITGRAGCLRCRYLEEVNTIRRGFEHEVCGDCGEGIDAHTVTPDDNWLPFAHCRSPWRRAEPEVSPAGDKDEDQISEAYDARWVAELSDGTFGMITRAYYAVERDGREFAELEVEYLVCTNPEDPGTTEINSEYVDVELDEEGPFTDEFMQQLAADAPPPDLAEWQIHAPDWARELLTIPD